MDPLSELSQRLREFSDFVRQKKPLLSPEQLRECFSNLSKEQKRALRGLLSWEPSEIPKCLSQLESLELSAPLKTAVNDWIRNPKSFLTRNTGSAFHASIYWRTVQRQEETELATIHQRFDDICIYDIAVQSGYHNGMRWATGGLADFAKAVPINFSREKNHSTEEKCKNIQEGVAAGYFWSKWCSALAEIECDGERDGELDRELDSEEDGELDGEKDRTGYLIAIPQGIFTEHQFKTRKVPIKIHTATTETLVERGIVKVAIKYGLFKLGKRLRRLVRTSSLEASIQQRTQSSAHIPTSNKRRKRNPSIVTTPPPPTSCRVTQSSPVVQNSPRSDFPASRTPTQNSTPQTTPNNELFRLQADGVSGQDTRLQCVPFEPARRDEQEPEAAAQATFNEQAASTSPAQDTISGERFDDTEDASYPRQPITAGERVGNTMNHAGGTESNNDQNSDREAGQWQGLGPSQAGGSQAADAILSQLFPNTEGIGDLRPSSASLPQIRDFSASDLNSPGGQTSAFDSPLMPKDPSMPFLNCLGAEMPCANYQGAQMPCLNSLGTEMPDLNMLGAEMLYTNYLGAEMPCLNNLGAEMPSTNYLGAQMPCLNSLGAEMPCANCPGADMPCANCLGAQMSSFTHLATAAGMHSYST